MEYADTLEPKWTESEDLDRPGTGVIGFIELHTKGSGACFLHGSPFVSVHGNPFP